MEPYDSDDDLESNFSESDDTGFSDSSDYEKSDYDDEDSDDSFVKPWKPTGAAPFETKKKKIEYLNILKEEPWDDDDTDFFFSIDNKCLLKK